MSNDGAVVELCPGNDFTVLPFSCICKLLNINALLEAEVGIGRLKRRFEVKNSQFHWLHKLTLALPAPTPSLHLC